MPLALCLTVMIDALEEILLPKIYVDLTKYLYSDSFPLVILGKDLTKPIPLEVGINTGCQWSAVNFIITINQWLKWLCAHAQPHVLSPNRVQGYADDVAIAFRDDSLITNMLSCIDRFLTSPTSKTQQMCSFI